MFDDSLVKFAQRLIRQSSLSGKEDALVKTVVGEMQHLGYDQAWIDKVGNAVGVIVGDKAGPTLLIDGHCDTVGVAPGVAWTQDPLGAEIVGDFMYGRGAADMKGALAAMVYAAAGIDRTRLSGRVVVSATVMEENLEGAALQTVIEALQPKFVVIGEATDLNLNRGGRGRAEIHLETIGQPAHSSTPDLGRNAILEMIKVVSAIEHLPTRTDPLLGPATRALTDIMSDPYPAYSVIPSRCRATYDRRLLLDETPQEVLGAITSLPELVQINLRAQIAEGKHTTYTGAVLQGVKFLPAWALPEDHPFVKTCAQGLRRAGLEPKIGAYRFCTNAAYSAGVAKIPTIGFGPGREEDAHTVDERLELRALIAAERGYRGIMEAVLCA
jgi:putative selenium metabolism hydrolase